MFENDSENLAEFVARLRKKTRQVCYHGNGDSAIA
jgi:hypothetical protein